jgi:hypothetical protein
VAQPPTASAAENAANSANHRIRLLRIRLSVPAAAIIAACAGSARDAGARYTEQLYADGGKQ